MVRDLVECSIRLVKEEKTREVLEKARKVVETKIVKILAESRKTEKGDTAVDIFKAQLLENLRKGYFDKETIEIEVQDLPKPMELVPGGAEISIGNIFGDMFPKKTKKRKITVK